MMSIVYIDEPAHSNKERRELKQVVSHTEENALILRPNNLTICSFLVSVDSSLSLEEVIGFIAIDDILVDVMLNLGRELLSESDSSSSFLSLEEVVFCISFDDILMDFVFKLGIRSGLSLIHPCQRKKLSV